MGNCLSILNSEMPDKVISERSIQKTLPSTEEFFVCDCLISAAKGIIWLLQNRVRRRKRRQHIYLQTAEVSIQNKRHKNQ